MKAVVNEYHAWTTFLSRKLSARMVNDGDDFIAIQCQTKSFSVKIVFIFLGRNSFMIT